MIKYFTSSSSLGVIYLHAVLEVHKKKDEIFSQSDIYCSRDEKRKDAYQMLATNTKSE